ncbi:MAG: restriction endonuclease subunit S [Leptolyngbyaceae cyanobacterium]
MGDRLDTNEIARVDDAMVRKLSRHVLQEGDIVYPRRGDLNKRAIVTEREAGWLCGTGCLKISLPEGVIIPKFLFYYLKRPQTVYWLENNAVGATMLNLSASVLRNVPIEYPAPLTQRAIADTLSAYDHLIENNDRRIALLEESVHLLYREWFVNLRFPGGDRGVGGATSDGIPNGWESMPVTEAIHFNPKTPVQKGEIRPYIPMGSLSESSMIIEGIETRAVGGGAKFKSQDTLLARITPCLENGKTAYVSFMTDDATVATGSTEFIVMRSAKVNPRWVYCLARSHNFRQHAINSMSGSDGRQRVKPTAFENYEILLPPPSILRQFDEQAEPAFCQISTLTDQNEKLREARDELLPRLMNGSIPI